MLGPGLACSFAPAMFRPTSEWKRFHAWLTNGAPQPPQLAEETPEAVEAHAARIEAGFGALTQELSDYRPDALVLLASDNGRVFTGVQVPQFATFLGDELWGSTRYQELDEEPEDDIVRLAGAPDLAAFVQRELVRRGFDMSYSKQLRPLGQPEYGAAPAFVCPARVLAPGLRVPVVPVFVNARVSPMPSGRRCYALGQALAEILDERSERVAILACGGLSHDHHHERAGWIDEPFDRWLLDTFSRGKGRSLEGIFDLESDALRGGGAEARLWTIVAGACEAVGRRARIVDYIPSYHAATGLGFAIWSEASA